MAVFCLEVIKLTAYARCDWSKRWVDIRRVGIQTSSRISSSAVALH